MMYLMLQIRDIRNYIGMIRYIKRRIKLKNVIKYLIISFVIVGFMLYGNINKVYASEMNYTENDQLITLLTVSSVVNVDVRFTRPFGLTQDS